MYGREGQPETARAALWRPTDVDDFVFAKIPVLGEQCDRSCGGGRSASTPPRSTPHCVLFLCAPTGCKNDPKLGKKRTPPVSE